MPKPFMIGIEIEEVALGTVLRKLNAMSGIVALHLNLDKQKSAPEEGDKEPKRARAPRMPRAVIREQLLAQLAEAGPDGLQVSDLIRKFGSSRKGTIYTSMHMLMKEGKVKRVNIGRYVATNAPPVALDAASITPAMTKVLDLFNAQATISRGDVRRVLKGGKNKADWQVKQLIEKGFIKKAGARGVYERTQVNGA